MATPPSNARSLVALLKSARDAMRDYRGLNGDLDRLPMLSWMAFLGFLEEMEIQGEGEAQLAGKRLKPAIEPPHRRRNWAAQSDGISSNELQFTLPDVLKVPPISRHGNVAETIGKFGGANQLCNAMNQSQSLLYAA